MSDPQPETVSSAKAQLSVAIAHDYLNQRGGAERVVLEMARVWPDAPIYTSLYRPESTFEGFKELKVVTSYVDRLPVDRHFRLLAPVLPLAFRSLGRVDADALVTSSAGWAHGIRATESTTHVVYCNSPARWLYLNPAYLRRPARRRLLAPGLAAARAWDQRAARRADFYIANSHNVRARIKAVYGFDAEVVHPPVDVDRFTPRPRGERFLVVSRLLAYKRVDLVVGAATRANLPLDVVGTGPMLETLRATAGPSVRFHGHLPDEDVTEMMGTCRAVILPGSEDFGLVPVEANAAGKPVVAFRGGGALESMKDGVTAVFFDEPTVDSLTRAMTAVDDLATGPRQLAEHARAFSPERFRRALAEAVERSVRLKRSAS